MFHLLYIMLILLAIQLTRRNAGYKSGSVILAVLWFIPLTLLLSGDTLAFSPRIVFSDSAQIVSAKVFLYDITVAISGNDSIKKNAKNVVIASAPMPGKIRVIKKSQVLRALGRHDINTANTELVIPNEIRVTRKALTYGRKELESLIRNELLKRNFIDNKNSAFSVYEIQREVTLPMGEISHIVKLPRSLKSANRFWLSFYVNGKLKSRIWANGTIIRNIDVLAVNRYITANEIITEDDLIYVKKNLLDLAGNYFTNKRAIIGKRALLNIPQGNILKKRSIGNSASVKAGDIVSILAETKYLTMSVSGKILSSRGSVGDTVMVLNLDSKEKIPAVVLNNKAVKVEVR